MIEKEKKCAENFIVTTDVIHTKIFVAISGQDFLVNSEDMSSWEPISPASAHQISQN